MTHPDDETRGADRDEIVAGLLDDFHRRRSLGERPMAEDYEGQAGAAFADFLAVLAAEQAIDDVVEPAAAGLFPRPFGEYTLLRELGRGAAGVVFEAVHRRLGRKVALKVIRAGFDEEKSALERFRREARALAAVKHDHVVTVYEAGEVDGRPFYAMELLDGTSLWKLAREKKLPPTRALFGGLAGVAEALQALHSAGIVHRDVKPSNIMVRADGRMVLADFGLARTAASEALTRTGEALGTPLYMSPEQVLGQKGRIDGRSDVYGLGATLYELVAGRAPCKGRDLVSTLQAIVTTPPAPLSQTARNVPADAERIVMKAIEKRPEDRYSTAAALAADLRAFAGGAAVAGRPVSAATRKLRDWKRWAVPVAATVLAAALAARIFLHPTSPARITVRSHPEADVLLDDAVLGHAGAAPFAADVAPGAHRIVLRAAGFEDDASDVTLQPGQLYEKEVTLLASDADDAGAVEKMAADLGVERKPRAETPPPAVAPTAAPVEPFIAVWPRGKVRIEDLDKLRVEVWTGFETAGSLQFFRRGEKLGTVEFFPKAAAEDLPFPEAVKSRLAPGDVVRWGWVGAAGKTATTEFRVVAPTAPPPAFHRAEEKLAQQPVLLHVMRARSLCAANFDCAAYREAQAALHDAPTNVFAWDAAIEALLQAGLENSAAYREAQAGLAAALAARKAHGQRADARPPK